MSCPTGCSDGAVTECGRVADSRAFGQVVGGERRSGSGSTNGRSAKPMAQRPADNRGTGNNDRDAVDETYAHDD